RHQGILQRLDQLPARAGRLHHRDADLPHRHRRGARRRADRGPLPAHQRVHLRDRPTRIAIGGSSAGAITAPHVGFLPAEDPDAAVGGAVSLSGAELLTQIGPGDAPSLLFHGTADPLVAYQLAVGTVNMAKAAGLDTFLTTWDGAGHVPYVQHR